MKNGDGEETRDERFSKYLPRGASAVLVAPGWVEPGTYRADMVQKLEMIVAVVHVDVTKKPVVRIYICCSSTIRRF